MRLAVYVALGLAVVIGPTGRLAARRLAPRSAALALVAVAVGSAACWLWALSLLAATLVNRVPDGSRGVLGFHMVEDPVPAWVGLGAALLLGGAGARLLDAASRELRRIRATHRVINACGYAGTELLVISDSIPRAFAVPSLLHQPGRIVVSTAMLRALDAEQRAMLLAHERSHLRHRHSWLRSAARLSCAIHPMLGGIGGQLDAALERWADEDAVTAVSSRRAAAHSLGRAALATLGLPQPDEPSRGSWRSDGRLVPTRVAALCDEAPRSRWLPAIATAGLVLFMTASAAEASHDLEALFDPGPHASSIA